MSTKGIGEVVIDIILAASIGVSAMWIVAVMLISSSSAMG